MSSAVEYNKARPYTPEFWRQIQAVVGAQVDGIPGTETAAKIKYYQEQHDLGADGKAGCVTTSHVLLQELSDDDGHLFLGQLIIDADGAPDAYHPDNIGLDYLANAGRPGKWWGLATDESGEPYIQVGDGKEPIMVVAQADSDPCPGYYVSTTALVDDRYETFDPRRYVDSTAVPFVALPRNYDDLCPFSQPDKGDVVVVVKGDLVAYALYADVGPTKSSLNVLGEGSIALARQLGHEPMRVHDEIVRADQGDAGEYTYLVLSGSGMGLGRVVRGQELFSLGDAAFQDWGGRKRLSRWFV